MCRREAREGGGAESARRGEDKERVAVLRANVAAAGAKKTDGSGGQANQALGRSRGGFGSKIRGVVTPLGHPVTLKLTGAEAGDSPHLPELIAIAKTEVVLADKGYDSDANQEAIRRHGAEPFIPPNKNRKHAEPYDRHL